MYTVSLQDWQAPKREGGAGGGWGLKNSRSETLKHQRERHYPENKKTETNYTNTVNTHTHTQDQT